MGRGMTRFGLCEGRGGGGWGGGAGKRARRRGRSVRWHGRGVGMLGPRVGLRSPCHPRWRGGACGRRGAWRRGHRSGAVVGNSASAGRPVFTLSWRTGRSMTPKAVPGREQTLGAAHRDGCGEHRRAARDVVYFFFSGEQQKGTSQRIRRKKKGGTGAATNNRWGAQLPCHAHPCALAGRQTDLYSAHPPPAGFAADPVVTPQDLARMARRTRRSQRATTTESTGRDGGGAIASTIASMTWRRLA